MKYNLTLFLFLLFSVVFSIQAQGRIVRQTTAKQPCSLKLKDSPTVFGLRLRMTKSEIKNQYPAMVFTADFPKDNFKERDNAGMARKAEITNLSYKENLEQAFVMLNKNDKILTFWFLLDTSVYGSVLKEVAEKVSSKLNLPKDNWEASRGSGTGWALYCDDFAVSVDFHEKNKPLLFIATAPHLLTKEVKGVLEP